MKYRKEKIYCILKRLYADIKHGDNNVYLKKIHGCQGYWDESKDEICIDYRKEIIPTLIHEFLHKWNPKKSETWVLAEEKRIVNVLTQKQIKNILKCFVDIL
jgi:calcineurin-like phosphoesterase family protein